MSGYLNLSGGSGDHASTPDSAALDITGDTDIIARVAPADYSTGSELSLVTKYSNADRQWIFRIDSGAGSLRLLWHDGTTLNSKPSTAATGLTDGSLAWLRTSFDVDNGSGGYDLKFWTSTDDTDDETAVTWNQLGTTIVGASTTAIQVGTKSLEIGSRDGGTLGQNPVAVRRAIVKSGIDGTIVFDADFTNLTTAEIAAKAFTEDSANAATVTLNGTAWRYIWKGGSDGGPRRVASAGQMLRTGRAQN